MTKARQNIHVSILYKEPIRLARSFEFNKPFPKCEPDKIIVSDTRIDIVYARARASLASTVFNKTRVNYLQSIALGLSQLEGNENKALAFDSATCSIDEKECSPVELPDCLRNLELGLSGRPFPYVVVKRSFGHDDLAKCLRIMISYYWASVQSFSQEERLKLVWGSFNALYRFYYRSKENKRINEIEMLDCVNKLLMQEDILVRTTAQFNNGIGARYKDFVRWRTVTGDRCRSIYIHDDEKKKALELKRERLRMMDKETLIFMRDCGCMSVPGKQKLKAEINDAADEVLVSDSPSRRISMLLCRYIYIFRCDAVHAEVEYPVFNNEKEREKEAMADLLEAAVIDFSEYLARNK